jgi:hypothetical protein
MFATHVPLDLFSLHSGRAKVKCGGVVDDCQVPLLHCKLLHKINGK